MPKLLELKFTRERGLRLTWTPKVGPALKDVAVRVVVRGAGVFSVWGTVDSGESAPTWAEPGYEEVVFGVDNDYRCALAGVSRLQPISGEAYIVNGGSDRIDVRLEIFANHEVLVTKLEIGCPPVASRPLPMCSAELIIDEIEYAPSAGFVGAHAYGGRTHGVGQMAELDGAGMPFVHGCIGLAVPVIFVHDPATEAGIEFEFALDGRPTAWLRPGSQINHFGYALSWSTDRLLQPGQKHAFGGQSILRAFVGSPIYQLRRWRRKAAELGIVSPDTPEWARNCNMIEFNMNPDVERGFTRLDDPKCRELLGGWKEMGYDAIFAVSPNHVGQNFLSPFDYDPFDAVGGVEGEAQALAWAHELGFKIILWVTTVGIDRDAPEVKAHPEWFTHRADDSLFYAWDSKAPDYVGYAPDGDPLSSGWRAWLKHQVTRVIGRGYDGIFIDGCIPRASNHSRWAWPGEARNAVEEQAGDIADHVRSLGHGLVTFVEDEGLVLQGKCEMTMGRYTPYAPLMKKAFWDHGMGGGPEVDMSPPARIAPEMARDYLRIRYASLLPGAVTNDILEGYISEAGRPWTVESLLSGTIPKTHSEYVDNPATYIPIADSEPTPDAEQEPEHRLNGHSEFVRLLKFRRDEALIRNAPLSIDAVTVTGDEAIVGMLRPSKDRAILALIQFANRSANVTFSLEAPVDILTTNDDPIGHLAIGSWDVREIMHSMIDLPDEPIGQLGDSQTLSTNIAPYGFRIYELRRK